MTTVPDRGATLIERLARVRRDEVPALVSAFLYFFFLLSAYYIVRPIRDEMGIRGGVNQLQWLFTATFVAMLAVVPVFGWLTSRFPRRRFMPWVYLFFIANLLLFQLAFASGVAPVATARAFFVWVSVFNLFVVSLFWSFMADVFDNEQAGRLFGPIAAGGTAGAICGPLLTAALVDLIGTHDLLLVSAALLACTLLSIRVLLGWSEREMPAGDRLMEGGMLDGIRLVFRSGYLARICLLIFLYTSLATFLYFQQAHIIEANIADPEERVRLFALMEIAVNVLTLVTQVFLTSRIIARLGLAAALVVLPAVLLLGFLSLGLSASLGVIVVVQVLHRAGNYALMRPAREMLFVVLGREQKYRAKNFIDTAVYRCGDLVSSWVYAGLGAIGFGVSAIALVAMPVTGVWFWLCWRLGLEQPRQAVEKSPGG